VKAEKSLEEQLNFNRASPVTSTQQLHPTTCYLSLMHTSCDKTPLLYEPVLTTFSATIGQRVMGIRVRNAKNPDKHINILQAYLRLIVKYLLGWLSFITIGFDERHRAIHDLAGESVVVRSSRGTERSYLRVNHWTRGRRCSC
jgi:hypothetical protein